MEREVTLLVEVNHREDVVWSGELGTESSTG